METKKINITKDWVKFEDLISGFTASMTYTFQNNSIFSVLCKESELAPDDNDSNGMIIYSKDFWEYKKGFGDLYFKALNNKTELTVGGYNA